MANIKTMTVDNVTYDIEDSAARTANRVVTTDANGKFAANVISTSGNGNAVTGLSVSNGALNVAKNASFQPVVTYSTTDLTAGSSALTTGEIYLVYEA